MYRHERMYFIAGHGKDGFDAKFQISLKARLGYSTYFGVSQTSVWDLGKLSAPMEDSSFRPSLFYYQPASSENSVSFAAGVEHESNGKAGADSRSIWIVYAQPFMDFGGQDDYKWHVAPKLFAYVSRESTNRDIADYRGYAQLAVWYRHDNDTSANAGWEIGGTARIGKDFDKGSLQLDLSVPLCKLLCDVKGVKVPGYLYLQLFTGYGETLLDYNRTFGSQIRIGYMLNRDR